MGRGVGVSQLINHQAQLIVHCIGLVGLHDSTRTRRTHLQVGGAQLDSVSSKRVVHSWTR